jgi:hypothetical protein
MDVLWESCKLCFEEVMSHHSVKNVLVYIRQLVMHLQGCCVINYCHLVWYLRTVKLSIKLWLEWRGIQIVRTHIKNTKLLLSLSGTDNVVK